MASGNMNVGMVDGDSLSLEGGERVKVNAGIILG